MKSSPYDEPGVISKNWLWIWPLILAAILSIAPVVVNFGWPQYNLDNFAFIATRTILMFLGAVMAAITNTKEARYARYFIPLAMLVLAAISYFI